MDGLKCFQRDEFTPVPGCAGHGKKDWDYCYDPTGSTELSGGNDNDATGLEARIGECDNDGQCKDGLKCFQRDDGETIPGCTGPGAGKDWDYCYDPSWTPGTTTPAAAPAAAAASSPFGPLEPGSIVALHSQIHNRFVRMNSNGNMDGSGHKGSNELPADWTWERFHVVDAGNGEIALWSEIHGKYIRMHENGNMDASGSKGKDSLPSDWTWERFKVVDGGNGQWALWNPIHNRYMRINSDGNMDGSGHKGPDELPSEWTWERFAVVVVQPAGGAAAPVTPAAPFGPLEPGSIVALHSQIHNRFVRMNSNGNMDGSG